MITLDTITSFLSIALYVAFAAVFLSAAVTICKQSEALVIERLGKFHRVQEPGITFLIPFLDRVASRVSMKEIRFPLIDIDCITADNASLKASAEVFVQIHNPRNAIYNVDDVMEAIESLCTSSLRSTIGEMKLDDTLSNRGQISSKILGDIANTTELYGTKAIRAEVMQVEPSPELLQSMTLQVSSERERRSIQLNAQAQKDSAIQIAEGEKQAVILRSQANLEAAKMEAEAIERKAEAEAKATKAVNEAIEAGGKDALNFFLGQQYCETLGKLASSDNSKILMMPLESSNMIASISGIAELLAAKK